MASARTSSTRDVLRNPDIARFLSWCGLTSASEGMVILALSVHLVVNVGPEAVGLLAVRVLPAACLGAFASWPASRWPAYRVLNAIAVMRCALLALIAVALAAGGSGSLVLVLVLAAIEATIATGARPAQLVVQVGVARSPAELTSTCALESNAGNVFNVLGALVAGFLVAALDVPAVIAVAAALCAVAFLLSARLSYRARPASADRPVSPVRDVLDGVAELRRDPDALLVVVCGGTRALLQVTWVALAVVAATTFLGMGTAGVGILATALAVGSVLAIPAAMALAGRSRLAGVLGLSLLAMGVPLVIVGVSAEPILAVVVVAVFGLANVLADATASAVIPRLVRGPALTRVVALGETLRFVAETLGVALVPVALLLFGRRGAVIACGVLPIALVALTWRLLARVDERANARVRLVDRIRALALFASLRIVELERVVSALHSRSAPAGTAIVRENDPEARSFYVLDAGSATVSAAGRRLRELGPGDGFGEIALLHRVPRTASVTADVDVELLVLDRNDFLGALTGGLVDEGALPAPPPVDGGAPLHELLRGVPALAAAGADERRAIAARALVREVSAGTVLCAQGETARSMFVLLDGEVEVSASGERLRVLGAGATFGDVGLLHDVVRTATVTALGPARVAEIDRDALSEVRRAD